MTTAEAAKIIVALWIGIAFGMAFAFLLMQPRRLSAKAEMQEMKDKLLDLQHKHPSE